MNMYVHVRLNSTLWQITCRRQTFQQKQFEERRLDFAQQNGCEGAKCMRYRNQTCWAEASLKLDF